MKRLFIEPLDVLMFRSERPFIARESYVAKLGIISPLTFEGALKSKVLSEFCKKYNLSLSYFQKRKDKNENEFKLKALNNEKLKEVLEAIGHPTLNTKSSINVLGIFFAEMENEEEWFIVPNDIVEKEDSDEMLMLRPVIKNELKIPGTECYPCFSKCSRIKEKKGLMSFKGLINYLYGCKPKKSEFREVPYGNELRTGISIEKETKKTREGYLYNVEFLRLKNWKESWGFILWYEDDGNLVEGCLKESSLIRLGGEGKGSICKKINEVDLSKKFNSSALLNQINKEKRFKLYLASPSYFGGYKLSTEKLQKLLGVNNLTLVGALPGKPVYIGGYDFAMNREKPLRRWVNAGAVYYYEFDGEIKNNLTFPIKIIDENIDMRCAFIGRW